MEKTALRQTIIAHSTIDIETLPEHVDPRGCFDDAEIGAGILARLHAGDYYAWVIVKMRVLFGGVIEATSTKRGCVDYDEDEFRASGDYDALLTDCLDDIIWQVRRVVARVDLDTIRKLKAEAAAA